MGVDRGPKFGIPKIQMFFDFLVFLRLIFIYGCGAPKSSYVFSRTIPTVIMCSARIVRYYRLEEWYYRTGSSAGAKGSGPWAGSAAVVVLPLPPAVLPVGWQ